MDGPNPKKRKWSFPTPDQQSHQSKRRHAMVTDCLTFLEDRAPAHHILPLKPKRKSGPKTCRRCFSKQEQEQVILLRYGSLTSDSTQCHTPTEVF